MARAQKEQEVEISGKKFLLKTAQPERLKKASEWLNKRLKSLAAEHPFMKPQDIQALLLLELAYERSDMVHDGKALLNQSASLLESINIELARLR